MCLAIPGKIIKIENSKVIVDSAGSLSEAIAKGIKVNIGDYVMVQFGMVTEVVPEKQAETMINNWKQMNLQIQ